MYTREEFERLRRGKALEMAADKGLQDKALDVFVQADRHWWIHQTTWLGEPILQTAQDMFALQEIICATRPKYIVEVGVAWAGSLLFYSTLMESLGGEMVIGIDIFVPDDLKQRVRSKGKVAERIHWINGSSLDPATLSEVGSILGDCRQTLVVLDSNHTHEHVLAELRLYSGFVGQGCYLVCGDTIVEYFPVQEHRPRPWGPGNNPKTALDEFLRENDRFEPDVDLESKLLFTCNPGGFLRARG